MISGGKNERSGLSGGPIVVAHSQSEFVNHEKMSTAFPQRTAQAGPLARNRFPQDKTAVRPTIKGCATARFWASPVCLFTGGILPHFRPNSPIFFPRHPAPVGIVSPTGMSHPRESRGTADRKQIRHGEGIPRFGVARGYLAGVELSGRGFNPRPATPDRNEPPPRRVVVAAIGGWLSADAQDLAADDADLVA